MPKQTQKISVTTPIAGGSATLLGPAIGDGYEITQMYLEQTLGATRNYQLFLQDSNNATYPVNQKDAAPTIADSTSAIVLKAGDSLIITGDAAADQATFAGVLNYKNVGSA